MIFGHRFRLFSCGYVSVQWWVNLCFFLSTKPKTKRYLNEEEKNEFHREEFDTLVSISVVNESIRVQLFEEYGGLLKRFILRRSVLPLFQQTIFCFFCLWWFNSEIQFPEWSSFPALCGTRPVVPVFASGMSVDPSCAGSSALRTFRSLPGCTPWGPAFGAGDVPWK